MPRNSGTDIRLALTGTMTVEQLRVGQIKVILEGTNVLIRHKQAKGSREILHP